jgi:hypothetical protein
MPPAAWDVWWAGSGCCGTADCAASGHPAGRCSAGQRWGRSMLNGCTQQEQCPQSWHHHCAPSWPAATCPAGPWTNWRGHEAASPTANSSGSGDVSAHAHVVVRRSLGGSVMAEGEAGTQDGHAAGPSAVKDGPAKKVGAGRRGRALLTGCCTRALHSGRALLRALRPHSVMHASACPSGVPTHASSCAVSTQADPPHTLSQSPLAPAGLAPAQALCCPLRCCIAAAWAEPGGPGAHHQQRGPGVA